MFPDNPYNYNNPIEPDSLIGRQEILASILRSVTSAPGESIALVGGRRMGKTSVLESLLCKLETNPDKFSVFPLPLLINLTGQGINSATAFFRCVDENAQIVLTKHIDGNLPALDLHDDRPPAPVVERLLPTWDRILVDTVGRRLRLILLLDECEKVVEQDWATDLYDALRHLLESRITRNMLKIVMAGSHGFLMRVRQRGSPLRGVMKYIMLGALDTQIIFEFIMDSTKGLLSETVAMAVVEQSGGHAFLTQYLMHHLWENGIENATIESVQELAANFHHERNDFQDWLNGLGHPGIVIYQTLLKLGKPATEDQIRSTLKQLPPDFTQALDAICYHGLAFRGEDGRYQIIGHMYKMWFDANVSCFINTNGVKMDEIRQESVPKSTTVVYVEGDYIAQDKQAGIDQRGQIVQGPQTNIGSDVEGSVLSGDFKADVQVESQTKQEEDE